MPEPFEPPEQVRAWEATLQAMELHLDEIRAGIEIGTLATPYEVPAPEFPMPRCLHRRALRLVAEQHDLEEELRRRMAAFAVVLSGAFSSGLAPDPVYVDRRG